MWDFIYSTADTLKRNAPDLTPVKNACRTSYAYGCAAVTKVDNTVRVNGLQRLNSYWPDDETRAKIGLFATKFTSNAADYAMAEGIKCVPGGVALSKIVSKTLSDMNSENHGDQQKNAEQAKVKRLGEDISGSRTLLDPAEVLKRDVVLGSQSSLCLDSYANQKTKDVIRIFMMKESMGSRILDDLMVPEIARNEKKKHYQE